MTLTGPVEAEAGCTATGVVRPHAEGASDTGRTAALEHVRLDTEITVPRRLSKGKLDCRWIKSFIY